MSLEPQTTAKCRLHTTKGPIDIELWAHETPITSRHFLQSVHDGAFNGCKFDRVIPNFIIQLGDKPEESDGLKVFDDEFNSRLKFNRRGLLGSVNANKKNTNNGKFFITLKETPELNQKNTVFGKVVDNGIFSVLKIAEGEVKGEIPTYPVTVTKSEVLVPFFEDLITKKQETIKVDTKVTKPTKIKKTKVKLNFGLEDDEEDDIVNVKMESAYDVLSSRAKKTKTDDLQPINIDKELQAGESLQSEIPNESQKNQVSTIAQTSHAPLSKSERKLRTLRLLELFDADIAKHTAGKNYSPSRKGPRKKEPRHDGYDSDFDNLDDDSDDGIDIFTHVLKFENNPKNNNLENEDLLMTIDNHNSKRPREEFYQADNTSSILPKKSKTT